MSQTRCWESIQKCATYTHGNAYRKVCGGFSVASLVLLMRFGTFWLISGSNSSTWLLTSFVDLFLSVNTLSIHFRFLFASCLGSRPSLKYLFAHTYSLSPLSKHVPRVVPRYCTCTLWHHINVQQGGGGGLKGPPTPCCTLLPTPPYFTLFMYNRGGGGYAARCVAWLSIAETGFSVYWLVSRYKGVAVWQLFMCFGMLLLCVSVSYLCHMYMYLNDRNNNIP